MLRDDTVTMLRAAIRACVAGEASARSHLDKAVAAAVEDAAASSIPAERLVMLVKQAWDAVLRDIPGSRSTDNADMREAIVGQVIKAYYVH